MHLRERFFKGVTELGPMTDRHHYNIPAILRGSHNRSSYYNTMFFLLGVRVTHMAGAWFASAG
jgi:hypothetical protein